MRSRNASSTSATASSGRDAREAVCSGVSITTSWAPTPVILSKRPSPDGSRSPSILSAGNLFGTTRYVQPGPFGSLPGRRSAKISGGVWASWPSQNEHADTRGRTGSVATKSDGRRARSVAMMTQRPPTGSLRSSGMALAVLRLDGPLEERGQGIRRWLVLEEDGADLVADRQAHRVAAGERQRRSDRARTLGDHVRFALDRRRALTLGERHAELPVAREAPRAGQHEVAEPGQARERPGGGPEGHREARHLGEPACDERRARVLAEPEPVGDSGRDGHDVFQRPARLDADDVPVRVEPELARAQTPLEQGRQGVVTRRDHRRGRTPERDLPGEGRARQHRHAHVGKPLDDHLTHAQVALGIEPFRGRHDRHVRGDGRERLQRPRDELGRHGDDHERGPVQRLALVRRRFDHGRNVDVGEVPGAPAAGADRLDDLALAGPETYPRSASRGVNGQRCAPAAAAHDRDAHGEGRRCPSFGSWPASRRAMFAWWRTTTIVPTPNAASTDGPGEPSSRAPSAAHRAARIEPSETYRKLTGTPSHTAAARNKG